MRRLSILLALKPVLPLMSHFQELRRNSPCVPTSFLASCFLQARAQITRALPEWPACGGWPEHGGIRSPGAFRKRRSPSAPLEPAWVPTAGGETADVVWRPLLAQGSEDAPFRSSPRGLCVERRGPPPPARGEGTGALMGDVWVLADLEVDDLLARGAPTSRLEGKQETQAAYKESKHLALTDGFSHRPGHAAPRDLQPRPPHTPSEHALETSVKVDDGDGLETRFIALEETRAGEALCISGAEGRALDFQGALGGHRLPTGALGVGEG